MNEPPAIEQSDFDTLLELLDARTMRDVVRLFTASVPGRLESLRAGIASGDGAAVATLFHTKRSGSGQLGARRLEALCAHAEKQAKTGDLSAASDQLQQVHAEFERCLAWFDARGWLSA